MTQLIGIYTWIICKTKVLSIFLTFLLLCSFCTAIHVPPQDTQVPFSKHMINHYHCEFLLQRLPNTPLAQFSWNYTMRIIISIMIVKGIISDKSWKKVLIVFDHWYWQMIYIDCWCVLVSSYSKSAEMVKLIKKFWKWSISFVAENILNIKKLDSWLFPRIVTLESGICIDAYTQNDF